jgi:nitrite reductase (NADH) small subunit
MTLSEIRGNSRVVVRRPPFAAGWVEVCPLDRLTPNRGVAALVGGRALALFLLADGSLHAIDNIDPISGASVLSRGIVGDADGSPTVASPMYKQRFDLRSGRCLDRDHTTVATHDVRERDGNVEVRLQP